MLDAEKRNWCLQHSEEIETIHFGIRYEPLQLLGQATANPPNEEKSIDTKHWVLVFAPPSREFAFTFEVMPGDDERKSITDDGTTFFRYCKRILSEDRAIPSVSTIANISSPYTSYC